MNFIAKVLYTDLYNLIQIWQTTDMASSSGGNTADFTYKGEQIPITGITNTQPKDDIELTGWLIAHLKVSKYNDVQEIVESRTVSNCTDLYRMV